MMMITMIMMMTVNMMMAKSMMMTISTIMIVMITKMMTKSMMILTLILVMNKWLQKLFLKGFDPHMFYEQSPFLYCNVGRKFLFGCPG